MKTHYRIWVFKNCLVHMKMDKTPWTASITICRKCIKQVLGPESKSWGSWLVLDSRGPFYLVYDFLFAKYVFAALCVDSDHGT